MAQLLFGKGYLISMTDADIKTYTGGDVVLNYVTPLIPAPEIVVQDDEIKMLKNLLGTVEGIIAPDDCILRATFNFIPRASTKALAATSATLPAIGAYRITGLPAVQVGKFADAFNVATDNKPWFYFGGGSLRGDEDGKNWTGTMTMMRFWGITTGAPITS